MAADANSTGRAITVGVVLFPGFEPLDVVGPVSVFGSVPGIQMVYIAESSGPVTSVTGGWHPGIQGRTQSAGGGGGY
jgi:putative intracellular protease/amidase